MQQGAERATLQNLLGELRGGVRRSERCAVPPKNTKHSATQKQICGRSVVSGLAACLSPPPGRQCAVRCRETKGDFRLEHWGAVKWIEHLSKQTNSTHLLWLCSETLEIGYWRKVAETGGK